MTKADSRAFNFLEKAKCDVTHCNDNEGRTMQTLSRYDAVRALTHVVDNTRVTRAENDFGKRRKKKKKEKNTHNIIIIK